MIAEQKDTTGLVLNSPLRSQRLGVKNFGKMASILQDTLYTDKELAPLREYSTNASDAHVEAGCPDRPIIVRLPNRFNPVLGIRDFGPGMDENRVWNVFCNYGESTKDASNDEAGMFGIGSKSAFAYGKSFTIVSFLNGIRKSYVCHTGGCNEGEFVELGSEPTVEENGLEIQIPVQSVDIETFVKKAAKFFAHWRVIPIFEGNNIEIPKIEKAFEGNDWYLPNRCGHDTNKPKFLMGNIPYDLPDISKLKPDLFGVNNDESHNIARLLSLGLVISSPIGAVDVAANRESLQLTDKTLSKMWEVLKRVRVELAAIMDKAFEVLPTMYEKKSLRAKYNSYNHNYHSLAFLLSDRYSKLSIDYSLNDSTDVRGFDCMVFGKTRRGARRVAKLAGYNYNIPCDESFLCVTCDLNEFTSVQIRNRVMNLIVNATNPFGRAFATVRVICVTDNTKFKSWCDRVGFDFPMTEVKALKEYKMSDIYFSIKAAQTARSINTDKNCSKFLVFDTTSDYRTRSDYFKMVSLPKKPTTKLPYITVDRYFVCDFGESSEPKDAIKLIKEIADTFGFIAPTQIVAVKKSVSMKLDSKYFIPLSEYFMNQVADAKKFFSDMVTIKLRLDTNSFNSSSFVYKSKPVELQIVNSMVGVSDRISFDGILGNTLELLKQLKVRLSVSKSSNYNSQVYKFFRNVAGVDYVKIEESVDQLLNPMVDNLTKIDDRYPMISLVDSYVLRYATIDKGSALDKIVNYINFVDSTVNKK